MTAGTPRNVPARNFWIGVASSDHVALAVAGGFVQINHGKAGPLERMRAGDGFAYYSPRSAYPDGDSVQAFTALGCVTGEAACCHFAGKSPSCARTTRRSSRCSTR